MQGREKADGWEAELSEMIGVMPLERLAWVVDEATNKDGQNSKRRRASAARGIAEHGAPA